MAVSNETEPVIAAPPAAENETIVNIPGPRVAAPVAADGETLLAVEAPWSTANFDPSVEGCPVISREGTSVPAQFVDQAISIGADCGVLIVKR